MALRKTSGLFVGGLSPTEFNANCLQRILNAFRRRASCDSAAKFGNPKILSDRRVTTGSGNDNPWRTSDCLALFVCERVFNTSLRFTRDWNSNCRCPRGHDTKLCKGLSMKETRSF